MQLSKDAHWLQLLHPIEDESESETISMVYQSQWNMQVQQTQPLLDQCFDWDGIVNPSLVGEKHTYAPNPS